MRTKNRSGRVMPTGLFLFSLFLSLASCINKEEFETASSAGKMLTFSVRVPGGSTPQVYSLDASDENEVETIEILLFDGSGNYTSQPVYCDNITTDSSDSKVKTFTAKVPEGTYNMVVLANSRTALTSILGSIADGDPKASVLEQLVITNAGKWNAVSGSTGYIPIPMWGEIASITVNASTSPNQPVTLTRMVAKIDVALTTSAATSNFKLYSVDLYNYYNQGRIVPEAASWAANPILASIPSTATKPATPGTSPLSYTTMTTPDVACEGEIYTFEAEKADPSSPATATCLVIGGKYGLDEQFTYYRVDFTQTSGSTTTYLDLLRNHHYKINIVEISGLGLGSSKEAFESSPVNIKAEVLQWNDAQISDIVFDGQYMLGVSQSEFTLTKEEFTTASTNNTLSVTTDIPAGWTIYEITDSDQAGGTIIGWLSTDLTSGAANATTDVKLLLTGNTTGSSRVGYIHLSAGRLTYVIKVTQTISNRFSIIITDPPTDNEISELLFYAAADVQPAAQQFKVTWSPEEIESIIISSQIGDAPFNYGSGDVLSALTQTNATTLGTPGKQTFNIHPPAITAAEIAVDPFIEKQSKIDFYITSGGEVASKSIFLRQINYTLTTDVLSYYYLDSSTYTFNVKSNASWQITSITQQLDAGSGSMLNLKSTDNLVVGTSGEHNIDTGKTISFTVAANTSSSGNQLKGRINVVFSSTDNPKKFDDVTASLYISNEYYPEPHNGWAGSNIYWNGSALVFDDVGDQTNEHYQGVFFPWGSLYGVSPNSSYDNISILYYYTGTIIPITTYPNWFHIPFYEPDDISTSFPPGKKSSDRACLYELTDHSGGLGDICKCLTEQAGGAIYGSKWRMPTTSEVDSSNHTYSGVGDWTSMTAPDQAGKSIIPSGVRMTSDINTPFFPASGGISTSVLVYVGTQGRLWTSTTYYAIPQALYIVSVNTMVMPAYEQGLPVRCVRE